MEIALFVALSNCALVNSVHFPDAEYGKRAVAPLKSVVPNAAANIKDPLLRAERLDAETAIAAFHTQAAQPHIEEVPSVSSIDDQLAMDMKKLQDPDGRNVKFAGNVTSLSDRKLPLASLAETSGVETAGSPSVPSLDSFSLDKELEGLSSDLGDPSLKPAAFKESKDFDSNLPLTAAKDQNLDSALVRDTEQSASAGNSDAVTRKVNAVNWDNVTAANDNLDNLLAKLNTNTQDLSMSFSELQNTLAIDPSFKEPTIHEIRNRFSKSIENPLDDPIKAETGD